MSVRQELIALLKNPSFVSSASPQMIMMAGEEIEKLHKALELAVGMLAPYEPGDSRAVSNEFVALASVVCEHDNPECWQIIGDALERERQAVEAT